jgi:tetratricopeptide (TPR) repeat protein
MIRTHARWLVSITLVLMVLGAASCSTKPKGDPLEAVRQQYSYWALGDYEKAYDLLAAPDRAIFSKEQYVEWRTLVALHTEYTFTSVAIEEELTEYYVGSTKYDHAVRVRVSVNGKSFETGLTTPDTYTAMVVSEERAWKVFRNYTGGYGTSMANAFYNVGRMYMLGKGRDLELYEAANHFRQGVVADPTYPHNHFGLGYTYEQLDRFDEAVEAYEQCIEHCNELGTAADGVKVAALVNLGLICEWETMDWDKAIASYKAALKIDPDDEYAGAGLQRFTGR